MSLTCCYNGKYDRVKGSVGTQLIGERAKIILDELQSFSLYTRTQCLQHIGNDLNHTHFVLYLSLLYKYSKYFDISRGAFPACYGGT